MKVNGDITARDEEAGRSDYRLMQLPEILARIERRLSAVGLSAAAASKAAGKPDAIRNIRRAVENDDRQGVSTATLNALAPVLKTTSIWLLAEAGPEEPGKPNSEKTILAPDPAPAERDGVTLINVRPVLAAYAGTTQAGSFRAVEDFDDEPERQPMMVLPDREFPEQPLFWFASEGDSMNALKPRPIFSGDRLLALDFEGLRGEVVLRHDMVVVVEQTLDGGHHRERSVKQVEIYESEIWFCPRSTNPRHKPIKVPRTIFTDPSEEDGRQVRVLAIVRSVVNDIPL